MSSSKYQIWTSVSAVTQTGAVMTNVEWFLMTDPLEQPSLSLYSQLYNQTGGLTSVSGLSSYHSVKSMTVWVKRHKAATGCSIRPNIKCLQPLINVGPSGQRHQVWSNKEVVDRTFCHHVWLTTCHHVSKRKSLFHILHRHQSVETKNKNPCSQSGVTLQIWLCWCLIRFSMLKP